MFDSKKSDDRTERSPLIALAFTGLVFFSVMWTMKKAADLILALADKGAEIQRAALRGDHLVDIEDTALPYNTYTNEELSELQVHVLAEIRALESQDTCDYREEGKGGSQLMAAMSLRHSCGDCGTQSDLPGACTTCGGDVRTEVK